MSIAPGFIKAQVSDFNFNFFFQECCLCNLRGGALKMTVDNQLVFPPARIHTCL